MPLKNILFFFRISIDGGSDEPIMPADLNTEIQELEKVVKREFNDMLHGSSSSRQETPSLEASPPSESDDEGQLVIAEEPSRGQINELELCNNVRMRNGIAASVRVYGAREREAAEVLQAINAGLPRTPPLRPTPPRSPFCPSYDGVEVICFYILHKGVAIGKLVNFPFIFLSFFFIFFLPIL